MFKKANIFITIEMPANVVVTSTERLHSKLIKIYNEVEQ